MYREYTACELFNYVDYLIKIRTPLKHLASRAVLTFISVSLLVNLAYQISQIRIESQQENLPENLQLLLIYQHQHYNLKIAVQYFR